MKSNRFSNMRQLYVTFEKRIIDIVIKIKLFFFLSNNLIFKNFFLLLTMQTDNVIFLPFLDKIYLDEVYGNYPQQIVLQI